MKVELPEEIVTFMQNLAAEITAQDNRATRSPYYYVVTGQLETAAPAGHGDARYYVPGSDAAYTEEALREHLKQCDADNETELNKPETDFDEFVAEHCEEYSAAYVDVEDNVFFTFKGYQRHMELNGHNYRRLKNVSSYIKYAGRNPEMDGLHKAIMAFAATAPETEEKTDVN